MAERVLWSCEWPACKLAFATEAELVEHERIVHGEGIAEELADHAEQAPVDIARSRKPIDDLKFEPPAEPDLELPADLPWICSAPGCRQRRVSYQAIRSHEGRDHDLNANDRFDLGGTMPIDWKPPTEAARRRRFDADGRPLAASTVGAETVIADRAPAAHTHSVICPECGELIELKNVEAWMLSLHTVNACQAAPRSLLGA